MHVSRWFKPALQWRRWLERGKALFRSESSLDFTVVITTRNRPEMLRRALASALAQNHERFDIVIVDDASNPPVKIESTAKHKITVVRSRHRLGFASAVNLGVRHAKGRWIAFLDDDDEYTPDLLRRTYSRRQSERDAVFSWCGTVFLHYDGGDKPIRETIREFPEHFESEENLLLTVASIGSGYGLAVDRKIFNTLGGFDAENFWAIADTEFFYRLIAAGHRPVIIAEPLMRVHRHSGPKMTDPTSYRNRAQQCELLRIKYAELLRQYPGLANAVNNSIDQLTAMALAAESQKAAV